MEKDILEDISTIDLSTKVSVDNPTDYKGLVILKQSTPARICTGRAGTRYKTNDYLRLRADHAVAMDAVWSCVDEKVVDDLGFYKVQTLVKDKEEYITRPDLGRRFSEEIIKNIRENCINDVDVQIIVGDGLSSPAITSNLKEIYPMIVDGIKAKNYKIGHPIFVKYARVATMDKISETLNAKVTLILIGERPGLATGESMSCYMAYEASSQKPESQRTVISNIHKNGMPPVEAGAQIVQLIEILMTEQKSGIDLKL
ncbi:ethanolamine ammonia-lyase subunit EutC [Clostridium chromiireducens]|uniref:Ethanolamine ammonia-lyase small subunit n=1 Tax=Clostridium chromiireducens TaxID=225345 RepID=A0A1V4I794_9CLOT|nr:ethanolamine ammonia-lyase subunit EutC [Clostridium chromiireducens]OPJ55485.1 ethanolamine ammonia-lyase light chain [Clostridium chromiireducens]RII33851.1 ethanolamine ammonia-lyase subunit EutC [Clostridium chromiireducens]